MAHSHSLPPALWHISGKNKRTSSSSPIPKTKLTDYSRPSVRFLVSSEEMVQTRSQTQKLLPSAQIVSTLDPPDTNQEPKFPSAKHWTKQHLDWLGVDFNLTDTVDLNDFVMHVSNPETWSSKKKKSIVAIILIWLLDFDEGVRQLRSVEIGDGRAYIDTDDIGDKAPTFRSFFMALVRLMTVPGQKLEEKERKQMSEVSKTALNSPSSSRLCTPDQLTEPIDPNYSGSSTTNSQDEKATDQLGHLFLTDIYAALKSEFNEITWQTKTKVHLFQA
jgi:hypothetical protein